MEQNNIKIIKANTKLSKSENNNLNKIRVAAYCRVSTDDEEQLNSFESQKQYYTAKISMNKDWKLVKIYADEAITGTRTDKRTEFKKMIEDALEHKIDLIITKSISRFARNTVDTLNYVRQLKVEKIAVFFEEENINTLSMDGELLLTILSSVAQQEVYNTSGHVKAGLKMKLQRSEMIGSNRCLGYDYNKETKTISINEDEAKIVRYIFELASEGYGAYSIGKRLKTLGLKTFFDKENWSETTIIGIIRNIKYYGDAIYGNTYISDPITKKREKNLGERDKYIFQNHHEAIVSKELWDKANEMMDIRSKNYKDVHIKDECVEDFKGKFVLSKKIICGYCGGIYSRRSHNQTKCEFKPVWKCKNQSKKGVNNCNCSKTIDELAIKCGFVKALNKISTFDVSILDSFLNSLNKTLNEENSFNKIPQKEKELTEINNKLDKLLDLYMDQGLTKETYTSKSKDLEEKRKEIEDEIRMLKDEHANQEKLKEKFENIIYNINNKNITFEFDDEIFKSTIKNIIVGDFQNNEFNSYVLTYVFKSSVEDSDNKKYKVILKDKIDYDYVKYIIDSDGSRKKCICNNLEIKIAIE